MSNAKALLIALFVSVFAVFLLFSYINQKEKAILEMATPVQVVIANRDIPEGRRIDSDMVTLAKIPQKYVQPGTFSDPARIVNRDITVPVLKGTQILESMFISTETEGIAQKIPSGKRAFSVFMTDVTAVGELIQPGDMVDLLVTVEVGSFEDGRGVSEEIITRTVLENILVLAVNQTSSIRRAAFFSENDQAAAGSAFTSDRQTGSQKKDPIKTLTVALTPPEVRT
ncbi:MAG: Flp pilus assembly protein CpaB [Desulfobacterales bacterium]